MHWQTNNSLLVSLSIQLYKLRSNGQNESDWRLMMKDTHTECSLFIVDYTVDSFSLARSALRVCHSRGACWPGPVEKTAKRTKPSPANNNQQTTDLLKREIAFYEAIFRRFGIIKNQIAPLFQMVLCTLLACWKYRCSNERQLMRISLLLLLLLLGSCIWVNP